jgi:predicted metal-dependent phosphoesterase TrpH
MLRMEFHCHTQYSKDSLTTVEELLTACRRKSIDRVVITDHNTIRGALVAKQLDPACVIVGEEIKTKAGELLAAFVQEEIPPNLEPLETIRRLKGQGAFISVSHPFDRMRAPWEPEALDEILPYIDAIETFNSRCMWPGFNYEAQSYARRNRLPGTSGSDAHTPSEIGTATMLLEEFEDAESLRVAMRSVIQRNRLSGPWVHFASRRAVREKRRTGHEV